jgi:hypothetical protein
MLVSVRIQARQARGSNRLSYAPRRFVGQVNGERPMELRRLSQEHRARLLEEQIAALTRRDPTQ